MALLVTLATLSGAGTALAADANAPAFLGSDGAWHFPDERVAHNALLDSFVRLSYADWRRQGVFACENPTILLSDNLGRNVVGRADFTHCRLWVKAGYVSTAQETGHPLEAAEAKVTVCLVVRHEVGHLADLPHSDYGIMAPDGGSVEGIEFGREYRQPHTRAYGYGPCGRLIARQFNRLVAGSRLTSRRKFDSIR